MARLETVGIMKGHDCLRLSTTLLGEDQHEVGYRILRSIQFLDHHESWVST